MVELVPQAVRRPLVLQWLGRLLLSTGVILVCLLGLRVVREGMDRRVMASSPYLLAAHTPEFNLPPATAFPTLTPTPLPSSTPLPTATATSTPLPTATPLPIPPIRIVIPAIRLNASISEITPTRRIVSGQEKYIWEPLPKVAAHYDSSGQPGEGTNIVLLGHNNTQGEVFRNLDKLNPGDELILYTETSEFHYLVQKKFLIPYRGVEAEGDAALRAYSAPTGTETVTLISCWPYATNANSIVIQAAPIQEGDASDF